MTESKYHFNIPVFNDSFLEVPLKEGDVVFVLGANGVGKSTLMTQVYKDNSDCSKRILANRQTWFNSNAADITSSRKLETATYIKAIDEGLEARWRDDNAFDRLNITLFDLINSENVRSRRIVNYVDKGDYSTVKHLSNIQSPLKNINDLLALSNIPIEIILSDKDELLARKFNSNLYSIAELSDGERNALLICADVLTAEPNQVIILDEPEKHLHRSISSTLLSTLFSKRKDCIFVVSTHDIHLPINHLNSSVVLIRGCTWKDKNVAYWDADLISEKDNIPDDVKHSILGSKRKILFVEGDSSSLDQQLYELVYPELSVIPKGNCKNVIDGVNGVNGVNDAVWVESYGLIDADDRTEEQIQTLAKEKIAVTKAYSVESLYYRIEIIKKVAEKYAQITGKNENELYENAIVSIVGDFSEVKDRMCARLCEKRVRDSIMSMLPNHKDILKKEDFSIALNLKKDFEKEEDIANSLIKSKDLNGIITRYPIRESQILNKIVDGIGINRNTYESIVRKLIVDDVEIKELYRDLLRPLTNMLN